MVAGLFETIGVVTPRENQLRAVTYEFVGAGAAQRADGPAGFRLDGEDAGGRDDHMIEVEGAGRHIVKNAAAVGGERQERLGDDFFAEQAEVAVAPERE